jgi:ABC-type ATPase with predicted acetyltransferase domain
VSERGEHVEQLAQQLEAEFVRFMGHNRPFVEMAKYVITELLPAAETAADTALRLDQVNELAECQTQRDRLSSLLDQTRSQLRIAESVTQAEIDRRVYARIANQLDEQAHEAEIGRRFLGLAAEVGRERY